MTKIKICGLTCIEDIRMVNEFLPDYIGFVFADSRRKISDGMAERLKSVLDPRIQTVGVFVNDTMEHIADLCGKGILDLIQLHGDENEAYIKSLRSITDKKIIRAVRVKSPSEVTYASEAGCDYLLLDAYHKEQYGGSGTVFDWSAIEQPSKPYFLAGGLHEGNVLQAIDLLSPYAVDVSSGVETDGRKDVQKIRNFITKVRSVK